MLLSVLQQTLGGYRRVEHAAAQHKVPTKEQASRELVVEQFQDMLTMFPALESCLDYGAACCLRLLLDVLLIPLRLAFQPWSVGRHELLGAFLFVGGFSPFLVSLSAEDPMSLYSYWYHLIRGTSILKLYVIFNMLEVAEKLLASFNHDVTEVCWVVFSRPKQQVQEKAARAANNNSLEADRASRGPLFTMWIFTLSFLGVGAHAFVLVLMTVTLNAALNNDDYSLFALLISNNFAEIKSFVFKKCTVENLLLHVCTDTLERVQQVVFIAVMLLRHAQSVGFGTVQPQDLAVIVLFEITVDYVKHFFIARFNGIRLGIYNRFFTMLQYDAARTYLDKQLLDRVMDAARRSTSASSTTTLQPTPEVTAQTKDAQPVGEPLALTPPLPKWSSPFQTTTFAELLMQDRLRIIRSPDTFVPNPCRRLGFTPYAYAAVLVWASVPLLTETIGKSPLLVATTLWGLVACRGLLAIFINGMAARYVVKSRRWAKLGKAFTTPATSGTAASPSVHHSHQHESLPPTPRRTNTMLPSAVSEVCGPPLALHPPRSPGLSRLSSTCTSGTTSPHASLAQYAVPFAPPTVTLGVSPEGVLSNNQSLVPPRLRDDQTVLFSPDADPRAQQLPEELTVELDPLDEVYPYRRPENAEHRKAKERPRSPSLVST